MKKYKSNIWKLYLFYFFIELHFLGGVLIPFFTDWGGITFAQIMILQSWFMFWAFVMEIPTGTVADFMGRKHSLVLATLVVSLGALVYGIFPNFYVFL